MVQLLMTQGIINAIGTCERLQVEGWPLAPIANESSLKQATMGRPISHGQIIDISKLLRTSYGRDRLKELETADGSFKFGLEDLLRGSKVYVEPPKPRTPPTPEYQALMARLRKEEEERAYERLMNPAPAPSDPDQWYSAAALSSAIPGSASLKVHDYDEVTFADINRQLTLIINVLLSIVACSAALWMVSSNWSAPQRLGLSMAGSIVVGVAEVVVYSGYLRRVQEAKSKAANQVETKEVVETWVIGKAEPGSNDLAPLLKSNSAKTSVRKRITAR